MGKTIDLAGCQFGKLTVLERAGSNQDNKAMWKCLCECGKTIVACGKELRRGRIKSCGCLRRVHAGEGTRLYWVWQGMLSRCYYSGHKHYKYYGGRGITVCDEWRHDFVAFREWALQSGYDENAPRGECTIDRTDNSKGYSPENCKWVSMKVQIANRRPRK